MFTELDSGGAQTQVRFTFEGQAMTAPAGLSVSAALLAAGIVATRSTPGSGQARSPYCLMGVCFECLLTIDGIPNRQGCMVPVADGMTVARQDGAAVIGPGSAP